MAAIRIESYKLEHHQRQNQKGKAQECLGGYKLVMGHWACDYGVDCPVSSDVERKFDHMHVALGG